MLSDSSLCSPSTLANLPLSRSSFFDNRSCSFSSLKNSFSPFSRSSARCSRISSSSRIFSFAVIFLSFALPSSSWNSRISLTSLLLSSSSISSIFFVRSAISSASSLFRLFLTDMSSLDVLIVNLYSSMRSVISLMAASSDCFLAWASVAFNLRSSSWYFLYLSAPFLSFLSWRKWRSISAITKSSSLRCILTFSFRLLLLSSASSRLVMPAMSSSMIRRCLGVLSAMSLTVPC